MGDLICLQRASPAPDYVRARKIKLFVVVLNAFSALPTAEYATFRRTQRKERDNKDHLGQIDVGFKDNATD